MPNRPLPDWSGVYPTRADCLSRASFVVFLGVGIGVLPPGWNLCVCSRCKLAGLLLAGLAGIIGQPIGDLESLYAGIAGRLCESAKHEKGLDALQVAAQGQPDVGPDCQFWTPRFFGPTTLTVFSAAVQDVFNDVGDRQRLALAPPPVRIGVVSRFEARVFGWLPAADFIITHWHRPQSGGWRRRPRCIRYRQRQSQFEAWSTAARTPGISS